MIKYAVMIVISDYYKNMTKKKHIIDKMKNWYLFNLNTDANQH